MPPVANTDMGSEPMAQLAISIWWEASSASSPPEYSLYMRQLISRSNFGSGTGRRQLLLRCHWARTNMILPSAPLRIISMATW